MLSARYKEPVRLYSEKKCLDTEAKAKAKVTDLKNKICIAAKPPLLPCQPEKFPACPPIPNKCIEVFKTRFHSFFLVF